MTDGVSMAAQDGSQLRLTSKGFSLDVGGTTRLDDESGTGNSTSE